MASSIHKWYYKVWGYQWLPGLDRPGGLHWSSIGCMAGQGFTDCISPKHTKPQKSTMREIRARTCTCTYTLSIPCQPACGRPAGRGSREPPGAQNGGLEWLYIHVPPGQQYSEPMQCMQNNNIIIVVIINYYQLNKPLGPR